MHYISILVGVIIAYQLNRQSLTTIYQKKNNNNTYVCCETWHPCYSFTVQFHQYLYKLYNYNYQIDYIMGYIHSSINGTPQDNKNQW